MKKICVIFLLLCAKAQAQKLFVYTEPASNMPLGSLGVRMANMLMDEKSTSSYEYHLIPERMWGVNKRLMLHADAFLSNAGLRRITFICCAAIKLLPKRKFAMALASFYRTGLPAK